MINTVEWNDSQKKTVAQLSSRLYWVGILVMVWGAFIATFVLFALLVATHSPPNRPVFPTVVTLIVVGGTVSFFICTVGFWFRRASIAFRSSVDKQGGILDFVVSALGDLKQAFSVILGFLVVLWIVPLFLSITLSIISRLFH